MIKIKQRKERNQSIIRELNISNIQQHYTIPWLSTTTTSPDTTSTTTITITTTVTSTTTSTTSHRIPIERV